MPSSSQPSHAPRDSAAFLMVTNIPRIPNTATVHDARNIITRKTATPFSFVQEIYVVTPTGKFVGVVPLQQLFHAAPHEPIANMLKPSMAVAHEHTDQERVAYLALRNKLSTVPVVNKRGTLLGAIPNETILAVMEKEMREDVLHMAGVHHRHGVNDNIMTLTLRTALRHRLPWLLLGLLGGIISARVIGGFEHVLGSHLIVAAFIPLIVNMGDAVGTQMEAFIIRDITLEEHLPFRKYFFRQFFIVFIIGCITSALLFVITLLLYQHLRIAGVVAISLLAAVLSSVSTGLIIPYLFSKLRFDPANASGPVATNVQDLMSMTLYLTIASLLL